MDKVTIHLALVDDWELSGNGTGDIRELQFEPMRKLVSIYNRLGIRGSFNAEVMQQLNFRQHQQEYPKLKELADEWDNLICDTLSQGHDIQLHVHPQWYKAGYDGQWHLTSDWSILNYPRATAFELLSSCKTYLETLLRKVKPDYKCISFRSGAWCIAPSPHMMELLVQLGIVFDMSIVSGVRYDTRHIKLDYTKCEEDFLPYYPVMTDARKVSNKKEPIICLPTNCFYVSRRQLFLHHVQKVKQKVSPATVSSGSGSRTVENYGHEWAQVGESKAKRVLDKVIVPYVKGKHMISDLAQLDYPLLLEMLSSIRKRARRSGLQDIPVVLENHTKDIRDFSDIERFLEQAAPHTDIKFLTLTELAIKLREGFFPVRIRS
jgi:hypothetical protein